MEVKTEGGEAEARVVTLLIRHLPEAIPHETLSRLFSHYSASSFRPCAGGRLRNCAFVDFKNETSAYQAQRQLNGLRFLGKVLAVERANKPNEDNKHKQSEAQLGKDYTALTSVEKKASMTGDLGNGSKSIPASEPIASRLGVDYPFPPHLEYAYPPPDGNILTNIVNALIAVPRFYTQVLHLMNKMNIPAPFRMALPTPPLPPSVPPPKSPPPPPPTATANPHLADLSSSESEMESDEEVDDKASPVETPGAVKSRRKRARKEAIVGPAVDKDVAHEAVGVKPSSLVPKEIPVIKKKNPVLQIKIAPKVTPNEQKDDSIMKESEEPENDGLDHKPYATPEEIESNKLAPEEILSLPKFKNYTVGNPTSVLYIKNLSKDMVPDDFFYIFGSLFGSNDAAKIGLNVKLMQEGRMRGQAFVTFPSVELAHQALNLVNGYVFKGKPMIIQFGRNPSAGKAN
ncbi:hypothetical protein P3X46_008247 [Hevea brasiliensis]|uniref:RRM domain-containing protein n=1 Tax=Hevea brasiliensis TaxID=3981 RepID=A0ABQ9MKE3_HEVBR|nr:U11/U12 small nuclear ribonucleoprotein 65 kDa protein [Hevea brasiliensis]XP_021663930.2 U11/U12 small nuclear ribonucleoprotein 65 kDa protein [Hevea brasiliensis]XP_058002620.1 U11/U12 small nuclear ribonucleoprotein 65 kDa protein [Hevea brasiliensis]KAJ9179937.1 hypothetical protein P3X46_008247 [Hevea brasiliensis]